MPVRRGKSTPQIRPSLPTEQRRRASHRRTNRRQTHSMASHRRAPLAISGEETGKRSKGPIPFATSTRGALMLRPSLAGETDDDLIFVR
ncbi:unnamed protein product [Parajaminaea phylloscopi]